MGYGRFSSYRKVREGVESGLCQISVNHFQPHRLAHSTSARKWQMLLLYYQKTLIPMLTCVLVCLLAFSVEPLWTAVACLFVFAISYFLDLQQSSVLIGLVIIAVGMTLDLPPVMAFGISLVVAYTCNLIWWRGASRIVRNAALKEKSVFDSLWNSGVLVISTEDLIYSHGGSAPRNFTPHDVKDFMDSRKKQ